MELDLELDKAIEAIKKQKPKSILLQLPDGLKPKVKEIIKHITENTDIKASDIAIWAGTCYGACDLPDVKGFDMLIHFGHTEWKN